MDGNLENHVNHTIAQRFENTTYDTVLSRVAGSVLELQAVAVNIRTIARVMLKIFLIFFIHCPPLL